MVHVPAIKQMDSISMFQLINAYNALISSVIAVLVSIIPLDQSCNALHVSLDYLFRMELVPPVL